MEKVKNRLPIIVVAAILMVFFVIGFAIIILQQQPRKLYPSEVRNYQGENLSSISDIFDNAIGGTQYLNQSTYQLAVNGLVSNPKNYTYDQIVSHFQNYEKVVTIYCVQGWNAKILWEGVLVRDVLNQSGVMSNAKVIIFHAADGYTTAMPLNYFYDNDILIAFKMNGLVIPVEKGYPFQLVAESKYGYKWIKWLTQIELNDNESYLGYWERRGYSNSGDIP